MGFDMILMGRILAAFPAGYLVTQVLLPALPNLATQPLAPSFATCPKRLLEPDRVTDDLAYRLEPSHAVKHSLSNNLKPLRRNDRNLPLLQRGTFAST